MAKIGIALLGFALLVSCSYDAGRLLRTGGEPSTPDASRSDTPADSREYGAWKADARDIGVVDPRDSGISGVVASTNTEATFVLGRGQGALTGYGHVSLGVVDSVTSPTCNGMQIGGVSPTTPPLTFNSTCRPSAITWGSATGLCVSGAIPGWSSKQSNVDYMINWGIMVGVATREPVQAIGVSYESIALTVSGWDSDPLLAVVHLADDASNLTYCAWMTSGDAFKLSSFNTECFFGSGKRLADNDVDRIDKVGVQVPSARSAITLSDFCLTKIEFAK
jgi:hypothetical protein